MSLHKKLKYRKLRRAMRVRRKFSSDRPRVSVFKSLNHIYAQIINDADSTTLVDASSLVVKNTGDKKAIAHAVGVELAKRALDKGLTTVAFDRGSFLYHGRVKALADGLREGGLQF